MRTSRIMFAAVVVLCIASVALCQTSRPARPPGVARSDTASGGRLQESLSSPGRDPSPAKSAGTKVSTHKQRTHQESLYSLRPM